MSKQGCIELSYRAWLKMTWHRAKGNPWWYAGRKCSICGRPDDMLHFVQLHAVMLASKQEPEYICQYHPDICKSPYWDCVNGEWFDVHPALHKTEVWMQDGLLYLLYALRFTAFVLWDYAVGTLKHFWVVLTLRRS